MKAAPGSFTEMAKSILRALQSCLLLCCMTLHAAAAEHIVFKYGHTADLRGLANVLTAFRSACLAEPVTASLPAQLLPDGYRIVTRAVHMWGKEDGSFPDTAILSKTGDEDGDIAGGYPIIDFMLPTAKLPDGACSVRWKRRWAQDYPDGASRLSLDMAASLAARVSYYLDATLTSKPNDIFAIAGSYSDLTTWRTGCRATKPCRFDVNARFDQEGVDLTVTSRGEVKK
ncbi:hypothetical protein A5906_17865 [Bradyrhizobium sacchari]|uniref:Uncharacterized protein n=2 Tax=Bradyrhizobium sacchari TaxID=1399419 RepID=A0A560JDE6_9BRAD|nr:hypothetical protein [Bradyrhizobium sacchari]OPY93655.1 hypothetical protein A5906_17865 [Bradyrhizobium sacchari]TWB50795.1 hypothetical protein FBZ94_111127 [Bradyrhizobium sacchari]TWB68997.1 hypothetical protein FBZ95_110117 [Bradyrhizobium sacchari]